MKTSYSQNYNSKVLVDLWSDFIDWKKRRKGEDGFLVKTLKKSNCKTIFDASLGDGCDSIYLLKQGFQVTSNEVDGLFIKKALENAKKNKVKLSVTNFDWKDLDKELIHYKFDAVILLGNSLTYLFSQKDQLQVLTAFRKILKPNGILLIDERNCHYILTHKKEILKGKFKYSNKFVYCGNLVHAHPIEIQKNKVIMEYKHKNGKKAFLVLYPFKKGELKILLKKAGFKNIQQYSDYKKDYNSNADFYQYLANIS